MKTRDFTLITGILFLVSLLISGCSPAGSSAGENRDRTFNEGWKFVRDSVPGAEQPGYDDSQWLPVDLPHDWSIMDLPGDDSKDQIGPFSVKSPGGSGTGYVLGGTAWYRKHFALAKSDAGKAVVLKFDGVYMSSEVWINGKLAGNHPYGYTPFWFDITEFLNEPGADNIIAVKVNNTGRNARWYSGSGIYRNVHLIVTDPVHVSVWGAYITTPAVSATSAAVDLEITLQNDGEVPADASVSVKITAPDESLAGKCEGLVKLDAKGKALFSNSVSIKDPNLWSVSSPGLYKAEVTIRINNKVRDRYVQPFGIRSIEYSAESGLLLNGEPVLLKGGCMHHDNGLLGSAAIDRAEERRIEIMKANGFNAIRCSHNPPSETFLNTCDRLGMLVIDEIFDAWERPKVPPLGSHLFFREWWKKDVETWMLRDRNHPSVIMWSIGNEIMEAADTSGLRIAKGLVEAVRTLDPTRPVTEAMQDMEGVFTGKSGWYKQADHMALLDIVGYNYKLETYDKDHELYPERIVVATETYPDKSFEFWQAVEKNPWLIGDFVWTGMDYLGESGVAKALYVPEGTPKPPSLADILSSGVPIDLQKLMEEFFSARPDSLAVTFVAWCGDIDITGEKKPQMYFRDIIWDNSNLELLVHAPVPAGMVERLSMWGWPDEKPSWNWKGNEGKPLQVRVFTKADRVKLELNGNTIGEKEVSADTRYTATFDVPYQPGELKATAYKDGSEVSTRVLKTSGEAAAIRLVADRPVIRADRGDLAFVTVEVVDENGQLVTDAAVEVKLILTGSGELAATGNACPNDMASVNKPVIKTYNGKAQAVVRPFSKAGNISLKAESPGLTGSVLEIVAK